MSINISNISKTFGTFRALEKLNLNVPTGELVALLGPSGSGKTTLLRIIAGLEEADNNPEEPSSIAFNDEDVEKRHARDRGVGFVFQHYALFRHMTVFNNIAFGLHVRSKKTRPPKDEIRKRVLELLQLIQLEGLANRYPHQLSGGQRQRVALARALAVEPQVLLLDEPFGALDAKVRKELRAWLRRLHDQLHMTSVFVTHDQDEALEVADRIVVMNKGKIEQIGTPDEVFHHPANEFVMRFLGDTNNFHARVDSGMLKFASMDWPYPNAQQINGEAKVFVRPHDLTIDIHAGPHPSMTARLTRLQSAGPVVRLDLKTEDGQELNVELSQERFESMHLNTGSTVYVRPRHIRVFSH